GTGQPQFQQDALFKIAHGLPGQQHEFAQIREKKKSSRVSSVRQNNQPAASVAGGRAKRDTQKLPERVQGPAPMLY
ncbi:hypothetical protein, partial [Aeromonas salmonicida]|uniref:hypothetical protein n=1 Tax=Aeromonas salmonicida TaxID=645 RepID=UPI0023EB9732